MMAPGPHLIAVNRWRRASKRLRALRWAASTLSDPRAGRHLPLARADELVARALLERLRLSPVIDAELRRAEEALGVPL